MNDLIKIEELQKLIAMQETVTIEHHRDANFVSWRNLVERTFKKVFGEESIGNPPFK